MYLLPTTEGISPERYHSSNAESAFTWRTQNSIHGGKLYDFVSRYGDASLALFPDISKTVYLKSNVKFHDLTYDSTIVFDDDSQGIEVKADFKTVKALLTRNVVVGIFDRWIIFSDEAAYIAENQDRWDAEEAARLEAAKAEDERLQRDRKQNPLFHILAGK